tara:strand:- start:380 stop:532 length:153 start_codon:yes stop_codon:yes gene_type:complete
MQSLENYLNEIKRDEIIDQILNLKLNKGSKLKIQKLQQKLVDIEKTLKND